jgi:hypothetical protein
MCILFSEILHYDKASYNRNMAIFWVIASCSLVEVYHHRPNDGGSKVF